jgi:hypothetical protein
MFLAGLFIPGAGPLTAISLDAISDTANQLPAHAKLKEARKEQQTHADTDDTQAWTLHLSDYYPTGN